jgi:orotate phosphoribosyltransferase
MILNQLFLMIDRAWKRLVFNAETVKENPKMKKELIDLLCKRAFRYHDEPVFKLVSGQMSRYYINCRPVTLDPRGLYLVGHLMFQTIRDLDVKGIGGLTFGADPIAVATAYTSELEGRPIKAFSIRKNQKDHGVIQWIEGDLNPGDRVVIIDDVATTGGSTIKAIERAASEGLDVIKVVILVDRQEGGIENIRKLVPDVSSVILRDELIQHWKQQRK